MLGRGIHLFILSYSSQMLFTETLNTSLKGIEIDGEMEELWFQPSNINVDNIENQSWKCMNVKSTKRFSFINQTKLSFSRLARYVNGNSSESHSRNWKKNHSPNLHVPWRISPTTHGSRHLPSLKGFKEKRYTVILHLFWLIGSYKSHTIWLYESI